VAELSSSSFCSRATRLGKIQSCTSLFLPKNF